MREQWKLTGHSMQENISELKAYKTYKLLVFFKMPTLETYW